MGNIATPSGRVRGCGMTPNVLRKEPERLLREQESRTSPRTTCGGVLVPRCVSQVANWDQIQFLLGHVST